MNVSEATQAELEQCRAEVQALRAELEETNRGVLALHAGRAAAPAALGQPYQR